MFAKILSPKDFWSGLIYIAFGVAALLIGQGYNMGTAGRMGPGYFPKVLAGLLILIGLASFLRSFFAKGAPIEKIAIKPLVLLLSACALFGLLLNRVGLVVSLLVLVLVSAAASREFRLDWRAALGLVVLVVFCVLVFVKGLGVPMPIVGAWLEPYVGPFAAWLQ